MHTLIQNFVLNIKEDKTTLCRNERTLHFACIPEDKIKELELEVQKIIQQSSYNIENRARLKSFNQKNKIALKYAKRRLFRHLLKLNDK